MFCTRVADTSACKRLAAESVDHMLDRGHEHWKMNDEEAIADTVAARSSAIPGSSVPPHRSEPILPVSNTSPKNIQHACDDLHLPSLGRASVYQYCIGAMHIADELWGLSLTPSLTITKATNHCSMQRATIQVSSHLYNLKNQAKDSTFM